MALRLFQSSIEPRCAYCSHGRELGQEQILCPKKGVMAAGSRPDPPNWREWA